MENQPCLAEQKLTTLMKHISMGIVEIDSAGKIIYQNLKAETLLKPILVANNIKGNNLFAILQPVVPSIVEKIKTFPENSGNTVINELSNFSLIFGGEKLERHYHFTVTKITGCILISFDDVTEKYQKEKAMLQLAQPALPGLDMVADTFNLTSRTLQRRLVQEGTSFRQIAEGLKRQVCHLLLLHDRYSVADISLLLGYSDAAAFIHSFKKWYGATPAKLRKQTPPASRGTATG